MSNRIEEAKKRVAELENKDYTSPRIEEAKKRVEALNNKQSNLKENRRFENTSFVDTSKMEEKTTEWNESTRQALNREDKVVPAIAGATSSFIYGVGEKPAKAFMNATFTQPTWIDSAYKQMLKDIERSNEKKKEQGKGNWDTSFWKEKVEKSEERLETNKQKVNKAFEQLEGYVAPNKTAKMIGNVAGYLALGKELVASGVSAPLTYGGLSAVEEYAEGGSTRDTAVEFAKGALFGKFLKAFKGGSKALQTVGKKTLAEYGRYFLKSFLAYGGASASTQVFDVLKEEPNFDYVDWEKVQQGIVSGKYKNIEDYLDSTEYVLDVTKNRFSQVVLNALAGSLIDTATTAYADSKTQTQLNGKRIDALNKLGLTEDATKEDIRKAHRKLVKLYHTDINTGNIEKFREIQEAYEFLTNTNIIPSMTQATPTQSSSTTSPVTVNKAPQTNVTNTINNIVQNVPVSSIVQKTPEIVENLPENEKISQKSIQNVSNLQKTEELVETNIGKIPVAEYRDIMAQQAGFDDYADMRKNGIKLGNKYDIEDNQKTETEATQIVDKSKILVSENTLKETQKIVKEHFEINDSAADAITRIETLLENDNGIDTEVVFGHPKSEAIHEKAVELYNNATQKETTQFATKDKIKGLKVELDYAEMKYKEHAKALNYTEKAREGFEQWDKERKRLQKELEKLENAVDITNETLYNSEELYDDGRATKQGELVDEFKKELTDKQWVEYFKKVDNHGKKYNFGNNEKNVIAVGNKLVFSTYTNGKPSVYDVLKIETKILKTFKITANKFADKFINKLVKEGYNGEEIRQFIRNFSEETLLNRNDTTSNFIANRSERTSKNDRRINKNSTDSAERGKFLQTNGSVDSNNDVKNSKEQGSFSLPKIPKNHIRLYRGLENKYDSNYDKTKLDNVNGYESWTDSYELARQYGNNVYYIDVPLNEVGTEVMNEDGDRFLVYKNDKPAGLNNVTGDEYMLYTDHEKFRDVKYNEVFQNNTPLKADLPKTDNQGRKLTTEQQEYFKDSKVRDEEGRLLEVYHGTPTGVFTVFDKSKAKSSGTYGRGFYFTNSKSHASQYGKENMYSVHLKINNPIADNRTITKDQLRKFVQAIAENEDYGIENYGYDATVDSVTDSVWGKNDFGMILDLNVTSVGDMVEAIKLFNQVNGTNYDGIITDTEYVVFESNQIKNVDNTNPTSDPDIRLSRKEGNQDSYKTNAERMSALIEQKINNIESGKVKREEGLGTISRKEIRQKIEKYLGRAIRTGGFRQRAYAIYKPAIQSIRTKQLTDIDSIIHELGHHVDLAQLNVTPTKDVLNWKKQHKELAMEMNNLCEIAFGNVYDRTPRTKLEEGFAEFTRRYIIDTDNAIKKYPYLADLITEARENNQELDKIFTDLINDVKTYINMKPEERIISNVSINEDEKKDFTIGKVVDRLMYEIYDDNWYLKKATNTLAKNTGKGNIYKLKPSENPYILFRLANSGSDQTTNMLNKGIRDWDTNEKITEGFASVLEPITNAEEMMKLRMLLIAQRNKDYVKKGQQTGLREKDAITTVNLLEQDKKIKKTAEAFRKENDGILEYARREGLMTSKQINDIKKLNENYVAMNRVMDNEGKIISPSTKGAKVGKTVYQTTGSDREIIDPIESTIINSARIIRQVENNKVLKSLVKLGQASNQYADLFEIVPPPMEYRGSVELSKFEKALEKQGVDTTELDMEEVYNIFNMKLADDRNKIMSYIDNGKRVYVQFYDEDLYNVLKGMNGQNMSLVEKFLNWANTPLRYGATMANAEFAIPNAISDAQQAFLYSDATFIPVIDNILGIINTLAGRDKTFSKILNNIVPSYVETQKEFYNLYQQSGASQSGRFSTYREKIRDNATDIYGKKKKILFGKFNSKTGIYKVSSSKYKAITSLLNNVVNKALDVMTYASELTEESTRFQNFRKETKLYRKKGLSNRDMRLKAAINAKDITQDFGRTGKSTRSINKVIPFSAARVGSVYRFGEAIHAHPFKTSLKLGILIAFTLAIKAYTDSKENKHVEEMADQKKKDNFVIAFDKTSEPMTIKKIQGTARSIINLAEYLYDLSNDKIPEGKETEKLAEWAKDTMFDMLPADDLGNMTPQIIKPLLENWLNKDFYYKTDLIPQNLQGLKPEDQYDEYTSEFAILLGKALNVSPIYIDNIFEGYFAGVGTQILDGLDIALDVTDKGEQATKNKSEQFILKRFFASGYRSGASINEVYDLSSELQLKKDYGEATEKELEQLENLKKATDALKEINKEIKTTRNSLTLSGDEKQQKINKLQELRTDTARYYLGKDLIDDSNKEAIELYEYYPGDTTYKYKPEKGVTVDVVFTDADKKEYAELAKKYYENSLRELKKSPDYKGLTKTEKEKYEAKQLENAKERAKKEISKKVYERNR